jgi:hypothetical protein
VGATPQDALGARSGPPDSITEVASGWWPAEGSLFSCLLIAGHWSLITLSPEGSASLFPPARWSLITLPRGRVPHPCGFGVCKGGSWGSLRSRRGTIHRARVPLSSVVAGLSRCVRPGSSPGRPVLGFLSPLLVAVIPSAARDLLFSCPLLATRLPRAFFAKGHSSLATALSS